ncbi:response regulator, partial [Candidatus Poribacteria bacterium]|nr:response regulator [Candidatus Poribacteria bacterium]
MAVTQEKYRVMVVDDEEDIRTILSMSLSAQYEVFEAKNGLDAMLKLRKYEPDVALIDIMMPLMNGLDLAERIRATPGYQDMPLIALSALDSRDDIKKGYDSGADLYLTKPFDPDRVLKNVNMSLEGRPARVKSMTIEEVHAREQKLDEQLKRALARQKDRPPMEGPAPVPDGNSGVDTAFLGDPRHETPEADVHAPPDFSHLPENNKVLKPHAPEKPPSSGSIRKTHAGIESHITPPPAEGPEDRPRVMLVDDDEDFLEYARLALEQTYEVVSACDGFDALNKIPDTEPDLFIIDGMMPKMSGYQLIEMIKQASDTRHKPIIFCSAKGSPKDRKMIAQKGIPYYLVKPFETDRLVHLVNIVTREPDFQVAPKKKSIKSILYEEG